MRSVVFSNTGNGNQISRFRPSKRSIWFSLRPGYSDSVTKFSSKTVFANNLSSIWPCGSQQRSISNTKTTFKGNPSPPVPKGKRTETQELEAKNTPLHEKTSKEAISKTTGKSPLQKRTRPVYPKTVQEFGTAPVLMFAQQPQIGSSTFQYYQRLFPDQADSQDITKTLLYQQAKQLYPERFNLDTIGKIFESWKACLRPDHPFLASSDLKVKKLRMTLQSIIDSYREREFQPYVYDKVTYLSTVWTSKFAEFLANRQLDIKLSNNGFLFPETKELKVFKEKITRHDESATWCQLDCSEVKKWFSSMMQFTEKFLGKTAEHKVWYNFHTNHIDFKSFSNTGKPLLAICITMESGGPFIDFEDVWQNE